VSFETQPKSSLILIDLIKSQGGKDNEYVFKEPNTLRSCKKDTFRLESRRKSLPFWISTAEITHQNRKYVISKINSSLLSNPQKRKKRRRIYDDYVGTVLVEILKIFDYPCGQRLALY